MMAIELPSALVELAKVGVAGAVLYGLYMSGSLLKQREDAMKRPVPKDMVVHRNDTPIYAYMLLTLAVGALLII